MENDVTEETVRAIFFKHYSGDVSDRHVLNEALLKASKEIFMTIVATYVERDDVLTNVLRSIAHGRGLIDLFMDLFRAPFERKEEGSLLVSAPIIFVRRLDQIHKMMLVTVNYMRNHYDTVDPWFRKKFDMKALNMIAGDISEAINKSKGLPANVRNVNLDELNLGENFFVSALVGILGVERFKKFTDEYNPCMKVLKQCRVECQILENTPLIKES